MPVDYPVLPTLHSQLTEAELTGQKIGQGYLDARSTLADIGQTHSASALNLANARRADALSRLTGEQTKRAQAELTAYQKDQRIQDMVRDIKKFDLQIQQSPQYRALYKEDKMMSLRSQFSESSRVYTQSILDKLAPIRKMVDDGDLQGAATAGVNLEQTDPVIQQELQKPNSPLRYVWDLYNSGKPGAIAKANKLMDYFQDTLNIPAERAAAAAQAATDRETESKIAVEEAKAQANANTGPGKEAKRPTEEEIAYIKEYAYADKDVFWSRYGDDDKAEMYGIAADAKALENAAKGMLSFKQAADIIVQQRKQAVAQQEMQSAQQAPSQQEQAVVPADAPPNTIKMYDKDGKEYNIPIDMREDAEKDGLHVK